MPNAAAARVDDQVKHSEAREYRMLGAVGATLLSLAILGGLAALEIVSLGTATPLVVAGTVLVVGGASAMIGSAAANVAADEGRKVLGPDEGPIKSGISSIRIGTEKRAAAHLGSYASCNRHKHSSVSTLEVVVDVAEDVAGGLIQDAVSLFTFGLFGHGRFNPVADVKQGIKDAHDEHDSLEQILQGSKSVLIGSGSFHAARVGDKGTCGFTVGQGCETVIIGGETVTQGEIGDGDDPDRHITDLMGEYGGYATLAGGFLLALPAGIVAAGLETFIYYKFGEVQGAMVNLIPDEETRNKVNLALAMLPIFHAARGAGRGGTGRGGSEGGPVGESGRGPEAGGATRSTPAGDTGGSGSGGSPRAGRSENTPAESTPPAENPVHPIGEQPGGSKGSAPQDQAGGQTEGIRPAETPGEAGANDPVVQSGKSPGGLRAAEEGARPDLSPEENFPGQQNGNNCAPQSCQQIIRQATGVNHSEHEMGQIAERTGAYDPAAGTRPGGEADILREGGVPAHTQEGTPENIQAALDNGQGVVSGHRVEDLWPGDPNFEHDPNNPAEGGHAVHTAGLVRDADGNVTHYIINDTGTGTSDRMVPADQYHRSLDGGPIAVTDAPIRTPAAPRPARTAASDAPLTPGESTTTPHEAASRGDPPESSRETGDTKPNAAREPSTGKSTAEDPLVQFGERPGGMKVGEGENGSGMETDPDAASNRAAGPRRTIPDDTLDQWARDYADKVNSDRRWTWAEDMDSDIPESMQSAVKDRAVSQDLIPNIPIDKSTTLPGRPGFADFTGSILREVQMPETISNPDGSVTNLWLSKDSVQFRWLNDHLRSLDPNYSQDGGTWHHNQGGGIDEGSGGPGRPNGTMQLVRFGIHNITNHAGARSAGGWADAPR